METVFQGRSGEIDEISWFTNAHARGIEKTVSGTWATIFSGSATLEKLLPGFPEDAPSYLHMLVVERYPPVRTDGQVIVAFDVRDCREGWISQVKYRKNADPTRVEYYYAVTDNLC